MRAGPAPHQENRTVLRVGSIGILLLFVVAPQGWSCPVPVFRFALEKWKAAPFEVTVYSRGPLAAKDRAAAAQLEAAPHANSRVTEVDLDRTPTADQRKRWAALNVRGPLPFAAIAYPEADDRPLFWTGPLTDLNVAALLDSPVRRTIAARLLVGDAIVFILLEGSDKSANDAAAAMLDKELPRLSKVTRLPAPSEKGPQVESPLPLRIAFSYVRLSPSAPGEQMFVQMLRRCKPGVENATGPVVLPVFGRGRLLDALHGDDWNVEMLVKVIDFLFGACTCNVKDGNPGLDLLFAVDWESRVFPDNAEPTPADDSGAAISAAPRLHSPKSPRRWLWAALVAAAVSTLASGVWVVRSRRRAVNS
jgi:hypothetical protein